MNVALYRIFRVETHIDGLVGHDLTHHW